MKKNTGSIVLEGNIEKLRTELNDKVQYQFCVRPDPNSKEIELMDMNPLIGSKIRIEFKGLIHCTFCGRETKKSFSGGYCFPCSQSLAQCDLCVLRPHTCHYDNGTCREPEWGEKNCMIPHYVYLSNTTGVKVGITKHTQIPTRWIDQGAIEAIPILKVGTRYQSGVFEKLFSQEVDDKTNWRSLITGKITQIDLESTRDRLFEILGDEIDELEEKFGGDYVEILEDESLTRINYPVINYCSKAKSLNLEKMEVIEDELLGIKGQYFIFETGAINIRKYIGYKVKIEGL
ncbi:MAG: DUF2797 domain-containing protein [Bdellovibrionales bacterium]|jgi:hypothetical protein|nr:DUF2797 domain-containing protein [Bdellovibrionales bacterium]